MNALVSIDSRTGRRAVVALLGAAMLAACDSDRVVSPASSSAKAPSSAKPALQLAPGTIDIFPLGPGIVVPSTKYTILNPNNTLATAQDNGPGDDNNTIGSLTFKNVPVGNYYICQVEVPSIYELDHEPCRWVKVTSYGITKVWYFSAPMLSASWDTRDWYGTLTAATTFKLTGPRGLGNSTITDNGLNDLDPRAGHLTIKLPKATVYTVCQTKASAGHYIASPACMQVDDTSGRGVWVGTFVEPEAQVPSP